MSTPVLHFTPRAELEPQSNLEAFIEVCKQSEVLSACRQFALNVWDIGHFKGQNKVNRAVFSSLEASSASLPEPAMPQPFLDFAKATIVYLHDKRPVVSQAVRIAALRCLEAALREWSKGSRPTGVNVEVLDTAVELAKKQASPAVAYRVAGQLALIAELMNSKGVIALRQPWSHGLKKPQELGSRISKEALDARQEKLPSAATLRALAGIFQQAVDPTDVLVSSYTAVMLCAPERINEVVRLKRNCLVEGDGRFEGKLGLRWAGSKGAEDTTKWLPTQMVPVAREAVDKLLKVTEPAHRIAAWYTANPTTLYLHDAVAGLRGQEVLTLEELAFVLWGDEGTPDSATTWARTTNKLTRISVGGRRIGFRFKDVERAVVAMLPATFPYVPGAPELLCEEAMAVARTNETQPRKATYLCMFSCIGSNVITNSIGREAQESIFERFGYTEDDGSRIELRSHSLRHYLNMLAQTGGLSSAEIAIFSGRKDVSQNRAYDHMNSDEVQAPISEALKAGFMANIVPIGSRDLIARSEFNGVGIVVAHTTDYGWCTHNFASEPCQMYRDCINCEEQECVKGEEYKETKLRQLKNETEYLLNEAREALNGEEYGADTWVEHQTKTLERVDALLSIIDDPAVPVGARVRLNLDNAALITADNVQPLKIFRFNRKKELK
ncbi:integrase [Janthinobacterium agaricidamnosum]|uniref:Putative integrase n=1 Tax=Janthinobacterium agaricidamnosum NBRC 102515 = DSM 9628 TaxID=1349767 RepID=W0V0J0_9BURK|nr:integrase [Janthinobacterium agaricidamnosum]CDG80802.1 putative integrase [Janthinobacterium agaricidamnosum NBRC 102515 = DSM 9628]